ncbi:conserved hypothetical protein [Talaromyces stipitatus ATCC 10500]|uniref:C2H2-type domain-containing protein n=1 Tax=Talaromyces stipitatus (strain ATCC 10500 / CBS 375.48 / QM 6759 / NRRL 1006) TaxID=441959 RepID=B8MV20_TALSN|nr:uncharacterized protein TSTA_110890 [Talaromyces stipitatus ATCC 10500]EED11910.1 conserved hypothetical protein [Talaromyces stipitatus ATCC 10500]
MGVLTSFRQVARPYSLRYGAAKALDNSGSVSDALRNLIMHHADTRTFLKYYLSRRIDKDVAGIIRGLDPQEEMMRAACRMSRTIDPNRPQELTTAQSSSVNQLPEIQDLIRRRDHLGRRLGRPLSQHKGTVKYDLYQQLTKELGSARRRARDALLKEIQNQYDQEQPMLEVQRQLSGVKLSESVSHRLYQSEEIPLPQKRLSAALLTLPRPTLEGEMLRRTEAIDAIAAYCLFEEGDTCRIAHDKRQYSVHGPIDVTHKLSHPEVETKDQGISPQESKLHEAIRAVSMDSRSRNRKEKVQRPLLCFLCVGNPNLDIVKRTQTFKAHGDVTKHIKRKHLKHIVEGNVVSCGVCGQTFLRKMELQRHASDAHSTVT